MGEHGSPTLKGGEHGIRLASATRLPGHGWPARGGPQMSTPHGMRWLGILAGALILLTACGGTSSSTSTSAASAKSAADMGGMDALIAAAKKEGTPNVIALPPDLANHGRAH